MPTQVQFRRGTTTQNESFTGAVGELSVDTTLDTIRVHDGSTAGGIRLAKYSELNSGDITAVVAGTGLSGGATSGSATVNLSHLGLESLSDPNDDQIIFWDDSAGATAFLDIGTGLSVSGTTLSSSITQYADSDARGAISVTDSGGDGSLAYNSSTGVITYTGPSAAEVRAHITAGTGVSISSGEVSIGQAVSTSSNVTFADVTASSLDISGDVDVDGTLETDALTIGGATLESVVEGFFSASDAGGDGSFSYSNGVFTYTGPSASEVRAHLSAGTGVTYSGGAISIGQAVATTDDVTFADVAATGNVTITGNLDVNGTTTTLDTTNSTIADRLIELGTGTTGTPANDMGIVLERGSSDNAFIGWDESADKFLMGTGSFTGASTGNLTVTTGTLVANLEGNVTGTLQTAAQPNITSLGTLTTLTVDDITINGSNISDSGTIYIEAGGDIHLDADGGDIKFQDGGVDIFSLINSSSDIQLKAAVEDKDMIFRGNDGGTIITALTLDMSAAGAATFNSTVTASGFVGNVTGDVTGNADTATALATGRTIGMTGDVVWTSGSFDGSGNVTGTATIQADAVEQSMIADDAVGSDQIADNAVALGTHTTGNYMAQVSGGDGITISHTQGEGSTATITGTAIYNASGTKLN